MVLLLKKKSKMSKQKIVEAGITIYSSREDTIKTIRKTLKEIGMFGDEDYRIPFFTHMCIHGFETIYETEEEFPYETTLSSCGVSDCYAIFYQ
jgi:hypothetical protein